MIVQYIYKRPPSRAPSNEESAWAQWGKNLNRKKQSLNWLLMMWHVWLVWILTTKRKSLERVENFERYIIFSCYYLLIYSIQMVFILLCLLVIRLILQMVLLSGYSSFQFVSALNPDCSFVFDGRNSLGVWKDAKNFVLQSVPLFPNTSYYWRCDHTFWPALSGDGEDYQ